MYLFSTNLNKSSYISDRYEPSPCGNYIAYMANYVEPARSAPAASTHLNLYVGISTDDMNKTRVSGKCDEAGSRVTRRLWRCHTLVTLSLVSDG